MKNFRIIVLNRAKKILSEVCMIKKKKNKKPHLIVLFTSDVMYEKYIYKACLHATRFVTKIYLH